MVRIATVKRVDRDAGGNCVNVYSYGQIGSHLVEAGVGDEARRVDRVLPDMGQTHCRCGRLLSCMHKHRGVVSE